MKILAKLKQLSLMALFVSLLGGSFAACKRPATAVGKINKTWIYQQDLQKKIKISLPAAKQRDFTSKKMILEQMFKDVLLEEQARKFKIQLTDAEVEQAIAEFRQKFLSPQEMQTYIELAYHTDANFKEKQRLDLLTQRLKTKVTATIPPLSSCNDAERQKYYADWLKQMQAAEKNFPATDAASLARLTDAERTKLDQELQQLRKEAYFASFMQELYKSAKKEIYLENS